MVVDLGTFKINQRNSRLRQAETKEFFNKIGSNQINNFPLTLTITVYVSLRCLQRGMPCHHLNISQRSTN